MPSIDSIGIISSNFTAIVDKVLRGETFTDCLDFLEAKAKERYPTATTGALNNCRGRWFEVLLTYLTNYQVRNSDILFLKLGTASDHSVFEIFRETQSNLATVLSSGMTLNLSIPDLIILNIENNPPLKQWKAELCGLSTRDNGRDITTKILSGFNALTQNPIDFIFCKAFCSVKTSLRPDRKYQAMYEAEFMKAFQLRFFPSLELAPKYIMAGPLEANATRRILENNLSIISLANSSSTVKPTIDRVCVINTIEEMNSFIRFCQGI